MSDTTASTEQQHELCPFCRGEPFAKEYHGMKAWGISCCGGAINGDVYATAAEAWEDWNAMCRSIRERACAELTMERDEYSTDLGIERRENEMLRGQLDTARKERDEAKAERQCWIDQLCEIQIARDEARTNETRALANTGRAAITISELQASVQELEAHLAAAEADKWALAESVYVKTENFDALQIMNPDYNDELPGFRQKCVHGLPAQQFIRMPWHMVRASIEAERKASYGLPLSAIRSEKLYGGTERSEADKGGE